MRLYKNPVPRPESPTTVLRWEFARGPRRICCQVDHVPGAAPVAAFAVSLVPMWRAPRAKSKAFGELPAALSHHAALASALRATGWTLVDYSV
jgi:hypothetical protein